MASRERIALLHRLATHTEKESARRLADRLRQLDAEERRLHQIRGYLADYASGSSAGAPRPLTIDALRSQRGFLTRLQDAVDAQRGTVEMQRAQADAQAVQWRSARARSQSLERLGDRLAAQAAEHDARVEQRQLDEIASRRKV